MWFVQRDDLRAYQIRGEDVRGFLHRMSTNHVADDEPGQGRLNAFIDRRGRMICLAQQLTLAADHVFVAASESTSLQTWLDQYLFAEDVAIHPEGSSGAFFSIGGPEAALFLRDTFSIEAESLAPWAGTQGEGRICFRSFDGESTKGQCQPEYVLYTSNPDDDLAKLTKAAASVSSEQYEALRVRRGMPRSNHEISSAYNPLELGLHDAIHWSKGCYIGQEVIARIDNYDKQSKRLVGLVVDGKHQMHMTVGAQLMSDEKVLGVITSAAPVFEADSVNVLAMMRIAALEQDENLVLTIGETHIPIEWRKRFNEQRPSAD